MFYRGVGSFLLFAILPAWALDKALVDELAKLPTQEERKPNWYHVAIVQDGCILPVKKHCVRLVKKPFSVVVISKGPSKALIHFTPVKSRFWGAMNGRSLPFPLGSGGTGFAWEIPPPREITIDYEEGSHYWHHQIDDDEKSQYHEWHRRGEMEICVRHVEQVFILSAIVEPPRQLKGREIKFEQLVTKSTMARLPLNEIFIIPWSDEFVNVPGKKVPERKALPSFMMLDFPPKAKEYMGSPKDARSL